MSQPTPWAPYTAIAANLRTRFETLPHLSLLPSETLLADEFHVARNTMRRALKLLEDEGLIARAPGLGRVVYRPAPGVSNTLPLPIFRDIARQLRGEIIAGRLPPGSQMPSEAMLTRTFGVSRSTARLALGILEHEDLIHTVHGKGRFVNE